MRRGVQPGLCSVGEDYTIAAVSIVFIGTLVGLGSALTGNRAASTKPEFEPYRLGTDPAHFRVANDLYGLYAFKWGERIRILGGF